VTPGNIIMVDKTGILSRERTELREGFQAKWDICEKTNHEGRVGGPEQAIKGADVLIAMSSSGPGVIPKDLIKLMSSEAIVFACANPIPEIWPWDAKAAGARIVATGRSDFPNQVNNSIGFPAIFRGTLDVRARMITDEMCIAAAKEIAKVAEEDGLSEDHIIPSMSDKELFPREAAAVGLEAIKQGVARLKFGRKQLYEKASSIIEHSRKSAELLMRRGLIKSLPGHTKSGGNKRRRTK